MRDSEITQAKMAVYILGGLRHGPVAEALAKEGRTEDKWAPPPHVPAPQESMV